MREEEKEEKLEDFRIAGEIARKIKKELKSVVEGEKLIVEIAEYIERRIREEGAKPAFPVNISINEIAAHYTPKENDEIRAREEDLIKIDFGVAYGEGISDTAVSINISKKYEELIKAGELALENALKSMRAGVGNGEIAKVIEETIKEEGFKPIANLSGHKIKSGELHAGIDVPNVEIKNTYYFKEGDVFAIEPFLTTKEGAGYVVDREEVEIYSINNKGSLRLREARKIFEYAKKEFSSLPFAERWITKKFGNSLMVRMALKELLKTKSFKAYPVLVEKNGEVVAQAEHTVIIKENGVEVIT